MYQSNLYNDYLDTFFLYYFNLKDYYVYSNNSPVEIIILSLSKITAHKER